MSAFNIALKPSGYAQAALVLLAVMPMLVLIFSPLSGAWIYALALLSFIYYWQWYAQLQRLKQPATLALNQDGTLQWFAPHSAHGKLSVGGLVGSYAIKLCWRDNKANRIQQRWVFIDQCPECQFRALARAINQCNWSALPAKGS